MAQKWWVLVSVAFGTFMATLDSSIVNIALPSLTKELGTDLYRVKWVVIVYLLVITCLVLPFGRLSDLYGRKKIFQFGFLLFTLGSLLCSLSPELIWLVWFRAVQAVGASMLMANGPAIITASFPSSERGAALGTMAMVVSLGLISGPSLGGLLITFAGWRSIFWVNVPIGIAGILAVARFVHRDISPRNTAAFDWVGAFLQVVVLVSFMAIFDPPRISISGSTPFAISRWIIATVMVVFIAVFIGVERESSAPLFDISLLKNRTFWTANLAGFLTFISFSSVSVLMPFFLEEALHFEPRLAGLFMTAIPLTIFVVAPISGRISDRLGSQELSFAGTAIGALSLFLMSGMIGSGVNEGTSHVVVVLMLCSIGLAMGLFQSPNNNAIMGSVPHSKLGVASGLLATVRNLGLFTGTGLSTSIFSWRYRISGDFISSLHFTHLIAAFVGVAAMIAALGKPRGPSRSIPGRAA